MSPPTPPSSVVVLDRALDWACGCLELALTTPPSTPTPCRDWDLGRLLAHLEDSVVALAAAAESGDVGALDPVVPLGAEDTAGAVEGVLRRAHLTARAWRQRPTSAPVVVDGLVLGRDTVALVGALEVAVHGWDVARAAGHPGTLPDELAERLHGVALAVVTPQERGTRFGPAVPVSPGARAGDRLLAHLGRDPGRTGTGAPGCVRAGWGDGTDARDR